jgi:hypothetical protein
MGPMAAHTGSHRVALHGSQWAFWEDVGLRGAGFPAKMIFRLAASKELMASVDSVLHTRAELENTKVRALERINGALDQLRASGEWSNRAKRIPWVNALHEMKMGSVPQQADHEGPATFEDLRDAHSKIAAALDIFQIKFAEFSEENSRVLREIASLPDFREAVTWQNRQAVHTALDTLRHTPVDGRPSTSKSRQDEELVASYLQRYCAKNDTIGFFGPVGWAKFVPFEKALTVQVGTGLLEKRKVYFETWPIEALARAIAGIPGVRPWLIPIRMPFIRIDGATVQHPVYGAMRLPSEQLAVLRACDGISTAKTIAQNLSRAAECNAGSEPRIYEFLAELARKDLVFWEFNIPFNAYPERSLRASLQTIGDDLLRHCGLNMLDELEAARESVAHAATCPEKLNIALEELEQKFARMTGASSTRNHGKTYGGRTILYEDCRRDVRVQLGTKLLESISAPLCLLLAGARWLTWELAVVLRNELNKIYQEMSQDAGEHSIDAALFFYRVSPLLIGGKENLLRPVLQLFQDKWARILSIAADDKPLHYSSESLRGKILQEFQAERAGWQSARHHSPDIMIAASSQEAIQKGDYLIVLGELHVGGNTLASGLFVNQHPSPEDLIRAREEDLGRFNVVPLPSKENPEMLARTSFSLMSPTDFFLEYGKDGLISDRSRALPVSSLRISENDGMLMASTCDGRFELEVLELLSGLFHGTIINSFQTLGAMRHTPRISIDRLVIKRESWRFPPEAIDFVRQKHASERFLAMQTWAKNQGLPRLVFFKVPIERKPVFLDLHSPTLVEIFCKMVRRTLDAKLCEASIEITEMFPTTEDLWLADADDQRFTSEFRIVAFDLAG